MKNFSKFYLMGILCAVILVSMLGLSRFMRARQFTPGFQKGMCYVTWAPASYRTGKSDKSLRKLKGINVENISLLVTWYQDNCFATRIFKGPKTPTDGSVRHAIETAHSLGIKVMIKPHLDLINTEQGGWRGEIACIREPDWQKWFESYKKFILHYAKIAEETKTEMLCIGTELTAATAGHDKNWRDIIKAVRKVYSGDLTYAANWSDEYLQIRFWDSLDYAGIDAYFPLSDESSPTYEELIRGWRQWLPEIENWQKTINKPVIFPEIGYKSSTAAAKEPWEHTPGENLDLELQVRCYRALVATFWEKPWFYGAYWWDWGTSTRMGGTANRGFTPQNKPAQDYIRELYSGKVKR